MASFLHELMHFLILKKEVVIYFEKPIIMHLNAIGNLWVFFTMKQIANWAMFIRK
jgi:hypothetical protein